MENQNEIYLEEYRTFISSYKRGDTSGEQIGEVISRMAQYFAEKNMVLGVRTEQLNRVAAEKVQETDENTGKPISVAKASLIIQATEEARNVRKIKIHIENIEQFINALKYLQKGILNEYAHMG